ncbi:MAG: hypothetical protein IKZ06_05255 [Oscillospiraceae bacterium]|nr:hypothetical protein [Oscillospiraceae bacterium]
MILWTPEPFDKIFPSEIQRADTLRISGGFIEGITTPSGFEVSRLVSTDLKNYLKTEYSPGYIRKH